MANNSITIESQKKLDDSFIDSIKLIVSRKFNEEVGEIIVKTNSNLVGGIIIEYKENKIILTNDKDTDKDYDFITIESNRTLSENEKRKYKEFSISKFNLSNDIQVEYKINTGIIGGIKIRYKDEEIDLSMDKILDEVFSKIN